MTAAAEAWPALEAALAQGVPGLPEWTGPLELDVLGRLLLALALGSAVGLERELSGKPAGLRTNMLICVGAALLTEISIFVASQVAPHDLIRSDPARIAAQIVSGIGFLGAGTILVMRGNVVGLTTAATIWVVAAIGMAVGIGAYVVAVGATVLVVLTLFVLGRIEQRLLPEGAVTTVEVVVDEPGADTEALERLFSRMGYEGRPLGWERGEETATFRYALRAAPQDCDELLRRLAEQGRIRSAEIE